MSSVRRTISMLNEIEKLIGLSPVQITRRIRPFVRYLHLSYINHDGVMLITDMCSLNILIKGDKRYLYCYTPDITNYLSVSSRSVAMLDVQKVKTYYGYKKYNYTIKENTDAYYNDINNYIVNHAKFVKHMQMTITSI